MKTFAYTRLVSSLLNRIEIQNTSGICNTRPKLLTYKRSPTITFANYMYINMTYTFGSSIRCILFFCDGLCGRFLIFCYNGVHGYEDFGPAAVTMLFTASEYVPFAHICRRAIELWVVVLSVEYKGVCDNDCLALLRRAKQQSDSQEAVLRARLTNEEVEDGWPTFEYSGV